MQADQEEGIAGTIAKKCLTLMRKFTSYICSTGCFRSSSVFDTLAPQKLIAPSNYGQ